MANPLTGPYSEKREGVSQIVTVNKCRDDRHGLDTIPHLFAFLVGSDATEAGSDDSTLNVTGHAAQPGDVIRFTSGSLNTQEASVSSTTANTITLANTVTAAPTISDAFEIYRFITPVIDSSGQIVDTSSLATAANQLPDGHNVTIDNTALPVQANSYSDFTFINTTYDNSTTNATSGGIACAGYSQATVAVNITKANTPTDISFAVEVSLDGTNYFRLINGSLGLWLYDDATVGTGISRAITFPIACSHIRLFVDTNGTTALNTFTVSNSGVYLRG